MSDGRFELTGGPVWHLRAIRRRNVLWQPFRMRIEAWLSTWHVRPREIILVGPSAGWCLPDSFLARFERIIAVDPDRLAPILFRYTHSSATSRTRWVRADFFADCEAILAAYPKAAVLFCNVAGQRRYVVRDIEAVERELATLKIKLAGRQWASFHDLLSGVSVLEPADLDYSGRVEMRDVVRDFGFSGEWLDHLTRELLPASASRRIIPWRFDRTHVHLVEAGVGE